MIETAENLRYLLWKKGVAPAERVTVLARWAECSSARAAELLRGKALTPEEQHKIADYAGISAEEIQYRRLVEDEDILRQNVVYLTNALRRGQHKQLADQIGVNPITISRWRSGTHRVRREHQLGLCNYFGLPPELPLDTLPLFLSNQPLGTRQRKEWLVRRIQQLDSQRLQQLFPALETLLRDP